MTPYRLNSGLFQLLLTLLSFIIIAGCSSINTLPTQSFEDPPLFKQIRARVGVFYTGSARTHTSTSPILRVNFGQISVSRFDQIFPLMFSETIKVPDWPPWREGGLNIDAVIELRKAELEIVIGNDWNMPDSVNVAYQICMFKPDTTVVNCWDTKSKRIYQRKPFECLVLSDCFTQYLEEAVRNAIAKFMLEFENDPSVHEWANRLVGQTTDSGVTKLQ